jgi:glycosyltransferase involved in cell wall biosynthesis
MAPTATPKARMPLVTSAADTAYGDLAVLERAAPTPPADTPQPLKKRLLVEGWRGVSHSFAMVNQHQLLALQRLGGISLHHRDMPFFMPHWNKLDTGAGFAPAQTAFIENLPALATEDADTVYRICAPLRSPDAGARHTLTFAVTEFGLTDRSFVDASQPLAAYTDAGNLVVTPSRWSRDRLIDRGFAEPGVRVVPHGVDHDLYRPLDASERQHNRRAIGIDDDVTVFLNVGLPAWNKGIDLLVGAFAAVHRARPRCRLILKDAQKLYGLGAEQVLRDLAAQQPGLITADVIGAISLVGGNMTLAELRLLFGVADCYVSPYRAEGFNLPVLEALACGTPVIVSSGGATDDFCDGPAVAKVPSVFKRSPVRDHPTACLVEPHLPSLVELMDQAAAAGPLHDPDALPRQQARQASRRWTWDAATHELMRLL